MHADTHFAEDGMAHWPREDNVEPRSEKKKKQGKTDPGGRSHRLDQVVGHEGNGGQRHVNHP